MYTKIKTFLDFIFALIYLIIFLPIILLIASIIKIETDGPVFLENERVGKDGKRFYIYKFRTMYVSKDYEHEKYVEKLIHEKLKDNIDIKRINDDPRLTKVGKIIRRLRLDEVPQLINILKGDMSFIGPRPANIFEAEKYEEWEKERLKCKPGITGLAQVNTIHRWPNYEEMIKMDIEYANNISFMMDLKILLKTIKVVLLKM